MVNLHIGKAILAGMAASFLLAAQAEQAREGSEDEEIVVTGRIPKLNAGLWQVTRLPSVLYAEGPPIMRPGRTYDVCVRDEAAERVIESFIVPESDRDKSQQCEFRSSTLKRQKFRARMYCKNSLASNLYNIYGSITPSDVQLSFRYNFRMAKSSGNFLSRIKARKIGECVG